ncbi:MAG: hypothetical protein HY044_01170 [Candidatus Woesebacteria bacterium]|nr:MAG: hypothetical protein HY044_01170 [Candidatus Woesebacteria bacterium]
MRNPQIISRKITATQQLFGPIEQKVIPSWNIAGRPKNVKKGTFGFNFQTNHLEYWNGSAWLKLPMKKI